MIWTDAPLREAKDYEKRDPIKLTKGINNLKFLNNGFDIEVADFNDKDKTVKKVVFDVEKVTTDEHGPLFVNWGETKVSLFGQLQTIAKDLGTLKGHTLSIVSTTGTKDTRYSVISVDGEPVE